MLAAEPELGAVLSRVPSAQLRSGARRPARGSVLPGRGGFLKVAGGLKSARQIVRCTFGIPVCFLCPVTKYQGASETRCCLTANTAPLSVLGKKCPQLC